MDRRLLSPRGFALQSESDLSMDRDKLNDAVAVELGYGETYDECGTGEQAAINKLVERGQRRFYRPPPINGKVHQWSFLRPLFAFDTVADQWEYPLPAEYAGIEGDITFSADSGVVYSCLTSTVEQKIRQWRSQDDTSGTPRHFAIVALPHDRTMGQRYQLLLYPTPDSARTMQFRMLINTQAITKFAPFPYGGTQYGEAILASCLAIAELERDGIKGTRSQDWMEQLAAAVLLDQDVHEPDILGMNLDGSVRHGRTMDRTSGFDVTYNGTLYE